MTDRERWTIYPLLIFSLALSLRDKVFPPAVLTVPDVRCQRLEVTDPSGTPRVIMGISAKESGAFELRGPDGKNRIVMTSEPVVGGVIELLNDAATPTVEIGGEQKGAAGTVTTFGKDSRPLVILSAVENNGAIVTLRGDQKKLVELGADSGGSGMFTLYGADQIPRVILNSEQDAGRVATYDERGRLLFLISRDEQGTGRAFATDVHGQLYLVLTAHLKLNPAGEGEAQPIPNEPEANPGETAPGEAESSSAPPAEPQNSESSRAAAEPASEPN